MKIKIDDSDKLLVKKLEDALEKVNGTNRAHTFTKADELSRVAEHAEQRLDVLRLPKTHRSGARVIAKSGTGLPKTYAYKATATEVELTRGSDNWFLTRVEPAAAYPGEARKRNYPLFLSEEQEEAARASVHRELGIQVTRPQEEATA